MEELEISRMLTVSISHLREKDEQILQESSFLRDSYSYIIPTFLNQTEKEITEDYNYWFFDPETRGPSNIICKLIDFARKQDCAFIRFDSDGPELSNFPLFDW